MSNQGMTKECKFCGAKFGQGAKLCPNCGSSELKLVVQESAEFLGAVSRESGNAEQVGSGKKKPKKKWKKIIIILVSVLVGIFVLLIVGFQLLLRWADKQIEKEKLSRNEQVERLLGDSSLSVEEWQEAMLPLLDELYLWQMDEEIVEVFEHAVANYKPIYDWEHYLYASYLSDFYVVKGIWEHEQNGGSLQNYHYTEILYYCLEFRSVEEHEGLTVEEKERLQKYVIFLHEDAEKRWGLTEEDLDNLYAEATEEFGYVDYFAVQRFLEERDGVKQEENVEEIKPIENLEEALKRAESLHGAEWKDEMFSILNQLYELQQYKMIYDIYVGTQVPDSNKSLIQWEHYIFVRALYEIYDIEMVLETENAGQKVKEWEYVNILMDYFEFEDFENRTNLTEEEKEKLKPLVFKLRDDAQNRWELSGKEWGELRNKVVSENNVIIYEEAEKFVESWMEKKGYANDGDTISAEMINASGMDDDLWEKKFYPKFDKLYETGTDEALYEISRLVIGYDRSLERWQHNDYVEMLECYYDTERLWRYEESDKELQQSDYARLLYDYLVFEHWETNKSLSSEEMEKLKPYREKILRDGSSRWNFSKEEWEQINDTIDTRGGYVYYFDASDFIEQWLEKQ